MKNRYKVRGLGGTWRNELMCDVGLDKAYQIMDLQSKPGFKCEIVVSWDEPKKKPGKPKG